MNVNQLCNNISCNIQSFLCSLFIEHSKAPTNYLFPRDGSEYADLANCCYRLYRRALFPDLLCGYLYSALHGCYW
ncbi:hypothetical protein DdX_05685 [Ditylenchus destructor]|uniref:Uncharacterized protein n=1 Tax=Ditylenchus destructor TaxID=166010 RepID=A0AAD4N816_9BILA|nr:hypothetical protein DdX_05685 [Ditylenchus destructor]